MNFIGGYRPHQMQVVEFGSGKKIIRRTPSNPGSLRCHFGFHDLEYAKDFKTKLSSERFIVCSRCELVSDLEDLEGGEVFYPEKVSEYIPPRPPAPPSFRPAKVEDEGGLKALISELNSSVKELNSSVRELTVELRKAREDGQK